MGKFRDFGRRIFRYYQEYPLTMNSIAGAAVYGTGEAAVQYSSESKTINIKRAAGITALGSVENGFLMCLWYSTLTRIVGSGASTYIVLGKCALDQLFFATQQDGLFLTLCALQKTEHLESVFAQVKKNFLTTWLNDCSVWPIVNFVGFAWVPSVLLPTYMSLIQLFWQVYVSSVAAGEDVESDSEYDDIDAKIGTFFDSSPIVASTLKSSGTDKAKRKEGPYVDMKITDSSSQNSVSASVTSTSTATGSTTIDSSLSKTSSGNSSSDANSVVNAITTSSTGSNNTAGSANSANTSAGNSSNLKSLRKGAMKALWRWEENIIKAASLSAPTGSAAVSASTNVVTTTVSPSSVSPTVPGNASTRISSSSSSSSTATSSSSTISASPMAVFTETSRVSHADSDRNSGITSTGSNSNRNSDSNNNIHDGIPSTVKHVLEALDASEKILARQLDEQWHQDRASAIGNAKIGASLLFTAALVRKLVFKI